MAKSSKQLFITELEVHLQRTPTKQEIRLFYQRYQWSDKDDEYEWISRNVSEDGDR